MQKKKEKAPSPFWKPQVTGDILQGAFVAFQKTKLGMAVQLDSGLVGIGTVLKQLFAVCFKKVKAGDKLKIQFIGKQKRTMIYRLWVNGKEVERSSNFPPADKKTLDNYFKEA